MATRLTSDEPAPCSAEVHATTVHSGTIRIATPAITLVLASLVVLSPVMAMEPTGTQTEARPYVLDGGVSAPVHDFGAAIRQHVIVSAPDGDGDGRRDAVAVDIIRPRESDGRAKVPVIMVASPYFACCGRGNESELKTYAPDGSPRGFPLFYDNYFVPRGYAVVHVDMAGTNRSDGCADMGAKSDVGSVKAVVDWLNGRADAEDSEGRRVRATWTNGKVGMIGKSYDGALANGVAATGVRGLKTIVPISALSSWYDYTRFGKLPFFHDYARYLAEVVAEGREREDPDCARLNRRMAANDGDESGAYSAFWSERDYRRGPKPDASSLRASVFLAHGLQDTNVKTHDLARWWTALGREGVRRKLWLSRVGHVEPFDSDRAPWVRTLHRWMDHELMGIRNGILRGPRVRVEVAPGRWRTSDTWPGEGTPMTLRPRADGRLSPGPAQVRRVSLVNDPWQSESEAITGARNRHRLLFVTDPLRRAARIAGSPRVRMGVRTEVSTGQVNVMLVDYGRSERVLTRGEGVRTLTMESCYGQRTRHDDACYFDVERRLGAPALQVLARGWARLEGVGRHRVAMRLTANDVLVPAGHRIGLVIVGASPDWVVNVDWSRSRYRVSLRDTHLRLGDRLRFLHDGRAWVPPPNAGAGEDLLLQRAHRPTPSDSGDHGQSTERPSDPRFSPLRTVGGDVGPESPPTQVRRPG